ncbi:hypothetical protein ANANG_G00182340, partial [Anguilla anguilla]
GGRGSGVGGRSPPSHHYLTRDLLPTIFRINFSGYYSPHPAYPCDSLHYVRKPDLKKKRGRPPAARQAMAEVPFVHGLGFPLSGAGFYHPSYGVPYSSPLGLSYYRGYPRRPPSITTPGPPCPAPPAPLALLPPPPPPSYMHHHAPHLLLNPAKFHKKKHKLLRQEFLGGGRSPVLYPGVAPELSYGWLHEHKHKHRHKHRDRRGRRGGPRAGGSRRPPGLSGGTGLGGAGRGAGGMMDSLQRYRYGKDPAAAAASGAGNLAATPRPILLPPPPRPRRRGTSAGRALPVPGARVPVGGGGRGRERLPPPGVLAEEGRPRRGLRRLPQKDPPGPGPVRGGPPAGPEGCSDSEEEEEEEEEEEPLTPPPGSVQPRAPPQHTNLFASALSRSASPGAAGAGGGSAAAGHARGRGIGRDTQERPPLVS